MEVGIKKQKETVLTLQTFLYKHSFFLNLNFHVQAYILIYFILQCIHIIYSLKVAWV